MSDRERRNDAGGAGDQSDVNPRPRVSTGGHMDPTAPGEMPNDGHGAGSAERNRDRDAGLGEGLAHEAADVPGSETIGGRTSSSRAGREILDAVEEREPRRGSADHTAPAETVEPSRRSDRA